jgi:hypothetical protein
MNSTRDRVISLLGQGYSQSVVASACGVSASWVSQLVTEPDVHEEVMRLRTGQLTERVEADKTLDGLEARALKLVGDKMAFVRSPMEAAKIYATLNKATRKTATNSPENDSNSVQSVTITLPRAAAAIHIQLNQNNQVIEVEGRSMATLPSRALPSLASSRAELLMADDVLTEAEATQHRLQYADAVKANVVLDNVQKELEVMIGGVRCVI